MNDYGEQQIFFLFEWSIGHHHECASVSMSVSVCVCLMIACLLFFRLLLQIRPNLDYNFCVTPIKNICLFRFWFTIECLTMERISTMRCPRKPVSLQNYWQIWDANTFNASCRAYAVLVSCGFTLNIQSNVCACYFIRFNLTFMPILGHVWAHLWISSSCLLSTFGESVFLLKFLSQK